MRLRLRAPPCARERRTPSTHALTHIPSISLSLSHSLSLSLSLSPVLPHLFVSCSTQRVDESQERKIRQPRFHGQGRVDQHLFLPSPPNPPTKIPRQDLMLPARFFECLKRFACFWALFFVLFCFFFFFFWGGGGILASPAGRPQEGPRWPQSGPKIAQDGPKMAPR